MEPGVYLIKERKADQDELHKVYDGFNWHWGAPGISAALQMAELGLEEDDFDGDGPRTQPLRAVTLTGIDAQRLAAIVASSKTQNVGPEEPVWVEFDDGDMWYAGAILWLWEASWKGPRLAVADEDDCGEWHYERCGGTVGECGETYPTHCCRPIVPRPPKVQDEEIRHAAA